MYDLLIKGGKVIDPAQGISGPRDVAVTDGKIAAVAADITGKAGKTIDAKGKIVCPGLVDLHTHSAGAIMMYGVDPDEDGVYSGVTGVCDCGSTGFANFEALKRYILPNAKTDMVCYLGLHPTGIAFIPEVWSWREVNRDLTMKIIAENPGFVKGIKMRAVGALAESLGIELIQTGKKLAREAGVGVMVHIGQDPPEKVSAELMESLTAGVLTVLDKGDIITHLYSPKFGQVIKPDGTPLPGFSEARARGVIMDVACGSSNLGFEIALRALDKGILPDTLSTDISGFYKPQRFVLTRMMSKFLALGLTLEKVIEITTINPARALGEEGRWGSLKVEMPASIAILDLVEGDYTFVDSRKNTLKGKRVLVPSLTIKGGVEIAPKPPDDIGNSVI